MKIVQGDELEPRRGLEHRGGTFHFRMMMEGEPGTADNFQFTLGQMGGDFYSPRHRHNFEQIRFQVSGTLDFGRDGKLTPGMVGYFPEGMHYGPQTQNPDETPMAAVLQFGGASGSGYLSRSEVKVHMAALAEFGEFKDGVFRRNKGVKGKKNLDGYQAIWEHANGRAMEYPKPRYNRPVFMDPENLNWTSVEGSPGVVEKFLGIFSECRTHAAIVKIEAGATYVTGGRRSLFLVRSGAGEVEGQPFRTFTTLFTEKGETAAFTASETTTLLHVDLPDLSLVRTGTPEPAVAAAAE